ncbi:LysR family transcriptional regulator [Nocardioides sp. BP30]|uniref:LysR family transcriptional regulator n=1 Tax=Nocardioides sp. BP30 TaxID=3036374 RepID=UPI002468E706|nr:LysR family transcriptional regulator [Nocardioides sp. BP30]WGL52451.1 LysR family transcriptional regulator [Nocardioides sp. BP30]
MDELRHIDWNLIPALDALLQERNVSRAARRLSISQSAASGALARLRRHFGDDLLDRQGNGYVLTPLAQLLVGPAREAVGGVQDLMGSAGSFDAHATTREFVVVASEYGQTLFGAALIRRLRTAAPHARLAFRGMSSTGTEGDWFSKVDGWIGPRDVMPDKPSSGLFSDRWVCIVDRDNTAVGEELPLSSAYAHTWVLPTVSKHRDLPWRKRLLDHGIDLNIAVTTESFGAVPYLVAGTESVGLVQAALLDRLGAAAAGVRMLECPWIMPPLAFTLWWHENREHDLAHAWFRQQVADCMSDAAAPDPGSG